MSWTSVFKQLNKTDVPERKVTASALCQARQKLKHQAFIELNHSVSQHFYQHYSYKTWHGFRLLAFDGSTVKVPRSDDCWEYFGKSIPPRGTQVLLPGYLNILMS